MPYELLVAMKINDEEAYAQYRENMLPILKKYGGGFRYDFKVSEVLQNETDKPLNRVFAIYFGDKEKRHAFFKDEEYIQVRKQYYEGSAENSVTIAEYDRKQ